MSIEFDDLNKFVSALEACSIALEREIKSSLEMWCVKFLDEVRKEIIGRGCIDTARLYNSFVKGSDENIWEEADGGLTIIVGSANPYGAAVNNGHKTCKEGEIGRWIPGKWLGNKFVYDPNEGETGMYLKQQWIDAKPFFTSVERNASEEFYEEMSKAIDEIYDKYLG